MDKWYWQLCLCSKGLQLMWIWWGVQRGCMSEEVLSLQMLWTCIFLKTVSWYLSGHIPHKLSTRGFNEHRRLTKRVGYIAQTSRLLFPPKKKQIFWIMSWAKIEFFHAEIYVTYSRIVICSLLAGIDCVANKSKFDLNPNPLGWKTRSFILSLVLWTLKIAY